jgi:hypothetical protein
MQTGEGQQQPPEILHGIVHHPAYYIEVDAEVSANKRQDEDDPKHQQQSISKQAAIGLSRALGEEPEKYATSVEWWDRQ